MRVPSSNASRTSWVTSRAVLPSLIPQVEELLLQFHTGHRIKRAKGFVQQQQRRICRERTGDPHPLTLTAGQLAGIARGELRRRKPDLSQQRLDARVDIAELPTFQTRNQSDIGGHSEMRKEACILNHVTDSTPQPDQVPGGGGIPSIETSPALGRSKPFTIFKAVVLPEPLRPRSTSVSPASTSKLRSYRISF